MRRNTKTVYEWRKAYKDKEELMLERGFSEVSPHEFYRDLFPEGSLQSVEHDGKGNIIATVDIVATLPLKTSIMAIIIYPIRIDNK